ncbi:hypothetical protein AL073_02235 [Loktanella sp. 1ANDIMAR09]|nr:hypothetical protein AL073_02235 [Loktanella sp. 1ANDIMAR09]
MTACGEGPQSNPVHGAPVDCLWGQFFNQFAPALLRILWAGDGGAHDRDQSFDIEVDRDITLGAVLRAYRFYLVL